MVNQNPEPRQFSPDDLMALLAGGFTNTADFQATQQPAPQQRPFDTTGPTTTAERGGQGFGVTGGADLFNQLFGFDPTLPGGGSIQTGEQPRTTGILNPSEFGFGFGQGVPGGDVVQFLMDAGFPDVSLLQAIQQGRPLGQTNVSSAAQQLGGIGLPSPQSLTRLGPSGLQFLLGLFETMLGIPEEDLLFGALQPFQGLGGAPQARQTRGFLR